MMKGPPKPTDAELEILTILWSRGASTVREVHEAMSGRKVTQYTTVLKQLQAMTDKGLVRRDVGQRSHVYEPTRPCGWTQQQLASDLLQRAFNGSTSGLMLGALSAQPLSKQELSELQKLLSDYARKLK